MSQSTFDSVDLLPMQVEMMAVAKASATANGDDDGDPREYVALVAASRALLAAVVRQRGVAAGWLWSNQGIWGAWLLTSWQLAVVQGWSAASTWSLQPRDPCPYTAPVPQLDLVNAAASASYKQ